jgi:predicted cobalt transporter CbtA
VDLSLNNIVLGGFIGLIGLALLMYGRKEVRIPHIVVGLVLIVYPYFVGSLPVEVAVAVVLVAGLAFVSRLGY